MSAEKKPTENRPITLNDVFEISSVDAYKKIEVVDGDWNNEDVPFYRGHGVFAATIHANLLRELQRFVLLNGLGYIYPGRLGFILEGTRENIQLMRRTDISLVKDLGLQFEDMGEGVTRIKNLADVQHLAVGHSPTQHFDEPLFLTPHLAVEIVYQDFADDMFQRIEDFLSHGTEQVWVVAPSPQIVWVYKQDGTAKVYPAGDTLSGEDLLPDFILDVRQIFET